MKRAPDFWAIGRTQFSQKLRKTAYNGASDLILDEIQFHLVTTGRQRPLPRSGKKFPPRRRGQGVLYVLTKKQHQPEIYEFKKLKKC